MTKQEAAALLRTHVRVAHPGNIPMEPRVLAAIADLLDPPREGLAKVQIALAWDDTQYGKVEVCAFGPNSWNFTQDTAFANLAEGDCTFAPTIITAYVPRPDRTVAQVEGEVEG